MSLQKKQPAQLAISLIHNCQILADQLDPDLGIAGVPFVQQFFFFRIGHRCSSSNLIKKSSAF